MDRKKILQLCESMYDAGYLSVITREQFNDLALWEKHRIRREHEMKTVVKYIEMEMESGSIDQPRTGAN